MKIGIRNLFVLLVLFGLAAFPVAASAWTEQDGTPAETQQEKPESEPDDEFDDFDESDEFEGDWEDDEEDGEDEVAELTDQIRESEAEQRRLAKRLKFVAQRVRLLKKMQRLAKRDEPARRGDEEGDLDEFDEDQADSEPGFELQVTEARLFILDQRMVAHELLDELRNKSEGAPAELRESTRDALKQLGEGSRIVDAVAAAGGGEADGDVEQAEQLLLEAEAAIERTWMRLELHYARQEGNEEAAAELEAELRDLSEIDEPDEEDDVESAEGKRDSADEIDGFEQQQ